MKRRHVVMLVLVIANLFAFMVWLDGYDDRRWGEFALKNDCTKDGERPAQTIPLTTTTTGSDGIVTTTHSSVTYAGAEFWSCPGPDGPDGERDTYVRNL